MRDDETTDVGDAPVAADVDALIGVVLASRYKIDKRLGRGTTGAVYRALHVKFGRPFAVKVLHADRTSDVKLVRRFEREAELGGKVQHPNVISVVDVGEAPDGTRFMVMELAIGIDLATLLQDEAPLDSSRVIHLLRGLLEGLHHAHERGVIHRDFKPENIIVERDDHGSEVPRVVDFGIAIARDEAEEPDAPGRLTTSGLVLGTPHYMAPEQATASAMDHRIDLFALGVVAYEMLTGVLPFDGSGAQVARANLMQPTPAMAERAPGVAVDPLLEAFTQRLMAKEPAARPPSAKAARELLDLIELDRAAAAALLGLPVSAAERPISTRMSRRPETVPDPVLLARRAAQPPPSWLTPAPAPPPIALDAPTEPLPAPLVAPVPAPVEIPPAPPKSAVRADLDPGRAGVDSEPVEPARREGRRGLVIAGLFAALLVAGGIYLATRSPAASPPARRDAGAPIVATLPPDAAPADASAPEPVDAAAPDAAPAVVVVAADAASGPVVAIPRDATVAIVPPPLDAAPPPPDAPPPDAAPAIAVPVDAGAPRTPTANDIAALYTDVGRALKRLSDQEGPAAADAFQARYRRIRLTDAMASEDARRAAAAELAALRRDIAAATRAP